MSRVKIFCESSFDVRYNIFIYIYIVTLLIENTSLKKKNVDWMEYNRMMKNLQYKMLKVEVLVRVRTSHSHEWQIHMNVSFGIQKQGWPS